MGQLIPPLTPEQQPLRHEQKYYISPGDAQYLSLLLRRTMQTDPTPMPATNTTFVHSTLTTVLTPP